MPKIKITSRSSIRKTFVSVNGRGRHIAHNVEVDVTDAELEVLQNSPQHGVEIENLDLPEPTQDGPLHPEPPEEHDREQGETGRPTPAPPGAAGKKASTAKPAGKKAAAKAGAAAKADKPKEDEGDAFDAAAFVDQTIDQMSGIDDLTAEQVAAVTEAETAREGGPRSTLIEKLEARTAKLAEEKAE